jgi:circadian clock protein KaiC
MSSPAVSPIVAAASRFNERMATGIVGLDHLLEGGLVRGNSLLVEGPPGSGKSTLAIRILHEGIVRYREPGLIITFEEFPRQLYHDCLQGGMDLQALERQGLLRVLWTPPAKILEGFSGKNDLVEKIVDSLGVRRLVIDSITHFKRVATSELELREVLARILSNLKVKGINALCIKELERIDDRTIAFEEYLVDASLRLHNQPVASGENVRMIEIRKTRGQGHVSGRHPFEMGLGGFRVYPRLRPVDVRRACPRLVTDTAPSRVSVGIDWIDDLLHGGLWKGSLNLVAGHPGTGKSVIAHHFLDAGLTRGEPGLMVTIRSTPEQVLAQAASLGMDWDLAQRAGVLRILDFHPAELCVEKMLDELIRAINQGRPERLVFDSIDDLRRALKDEDRVQDEVVLLASVFDSAGTTSLIMDERRPAQGAQRGGDISDYAHLARTVIQLFATTEGTQQRRFVAIGKHAGSDHCKELRGYLIDADGFRVEE